jgi:hypothetical protein
LRRKRSGIAVKIVVAISFGGVSRYIIVPSPAMLERRSIENQVRAVELWYAIPVPSIRSDRLK